MPGILTRSKSLRFLKGSRKEQELQNSMPPSNAPQTEFEKYKSATPNPRREAKLEVPDMAVRPSTSGGPGDRTTMFHMKKTNPAPSVYSQEHTVAFPSPTKSTTVLYTAEVTEEQGIIGIALGSPTVGSHWNTTPQASTFKLDSQAEEAEMATLRHLNGLPPTVDSRQEPPKPKLSRWKSLFKKAAPPPPPQEKPSFYQLAQTVTTVVARADSHHDDDEFSEVQESSRQEKEPVRTVSPPTYKPDIRASRKHGFEEFVAPRSPPEPSMSRGRAVTLGVAAFNPRSTMTFQRSATAPSVPLISAPKDSPSVPQLVVSKSIGGPPPIPNDNGPLLDVSIPDIKMERYSVMFGNLLQSNSNRSSSLLVRRQGTAEKLKPLNQLSVKVSRAEKLLHL